MSLSSRPCTPARALAALNAASMPSLIFWPSPLAAPLNGAEIPNRISLSVTPRNVVLTVVDSCPSCWAADDSDACWFGADCPTEAGAGGCGAGAAACGVTEAAATFVAGATGSFDGTLLGVRRSIDLDV